MNTIIYFVYHKCLDGVKPALYAFARETPPSRNARINGCRIFGFCCWTWTERFRIASAIFVHENVSRSFIVNVSRSMEQISFPDIILRILLTEAFNLWNKLLFLLLMLHFIIGPFCFATSKSCVIREVFLIFKSF